MLLSLCGATPWYSVRRFVWLPNSVGLARCQSIRRHVLPILTSIQWTTAEMRWDETRKEEPLCVGRWCTSGRQAAVQRARGSPVQRDGAPSSRCQLDSRLVCCLQDRAVVSSCPRGLLVRPSAAHCSHSTAHAHRSHDTSKAALTYTVYTCSSHGVDDFYRATLC